MKASTCGDFGVFDFREEDEVIESFNHWSKRRNPNSNDDDHDASTKYQFLQHASSGSVSLTKEAHTVEHIHVVDIDDDDNGLVGAISHGSLDSPDNAVLRRSDGSDATAERVLEQDYHHNKDNVKSSSLCMDITFRLSTENGHISPMIPGSPCNDSVDVGVSDSHDSIQEGSPLTSDSELEENSVPVPVDGQAQDLSDSGLGPEGMDEITLHTDYVAYGDKYFPASQILISRNTVKLKGSALEEESPGSRSEWKLSDILKIESEWISTANVAKVKIRLLAKDAETIAGASVVEVLEFLVHDPYWFQTKEHIMSLDVRYKASWSAGLKSSHGDAYPLEDRECSTDPYIPIFEEPFEEVVYPKGDADPVSISKSDVDLLQPETFINDTIIDFYIKYLINEISPQERQRYHFFNSFFFRKMADLDKNPSSISDGKAAFQRVRKWTRKVNIFEKDYIFIPVNYNLHWSLIVLCHPGEVANSNDENIDEASRVPCILHMDSIRGTHAGLKDLIQSYLLEEWKERKKETCEDVSPKFLNLRFLSLELPQQENCFDCGLFLLHFVELFVAEAPANFNPFRINQFENFLKPDWFMPGEASTKRVYIQRLIYELLGSHSPGSASPSSHHLSRPLSVGEKNDNDNGVEIISEKRTPGNSWSGYSLYSDPGQGMGFDMLYSTSHCNSDLDVRELLGQCQSSDRGAPFEQLGFPLSTIREVEGDEHLVHSTSDQTAVQPTDSLEAGAFHGGYPSEDLDQGFQWNSELSDQGGPEGILSPASSEGHSSPASPEGHSSPASPEGHLSPASHYSSDDSEETRINECNLERQRVAFGENEILDQAKENVDSLTESYASASSDMMETPAEDFQELAKMHGSDDFEDPVAYNQEELNEPSGQEPNKLKDDNVVGVEKMLVVEESSSDSEEEQPSKRLRLSPSCDDEGEPKPL